MAVEVVAIAVAAEGRAADQNICKHVRCPGLRVHARMADRTVGVHH